MDVNLLGLARINTNPYADSRADFHRIFSRYAGAVQQVSNLLECFFWCHALILTVWIMIVTIPPSSLRFMPSTTHPVSLPYPPDNLLRGTQIEPKSGVERHSLHLIRNPYRGSGAIGQVELSGLSLRLWLTAGSLRGEYCHRLNTAEFLDVQPSDMAFDYRASDGQKRKNPFKWAGWREIGRRTERLTIPNQPI